MTSERAAADFYIDRSPPAGRRRGPSSWSSLRRCAMYITELFIGTRAAVSFTGKPEEKDGANTGNRLN